MLQVNICNELPFLPLWGTPATHSVLFYLLCLCQPWLTKTWGGGSFLRFCCLTWRDMAHIRFGEEIRAWQSWRPLPPSRIYLLCLLLMPTALQMEGSRAQSRPVRTLTTVTCLLNTCKRKIILTWEDEWDLAVVVAHFKHTRVITVILQLQAKYPLLKHLT